MKKPTKAAAKIPLKPVKKRLLWLDILVGTLTVVLVGCSFWLTTRDVQTDLACNQVGQSHKVQVAADAFTPQTLQLQRCDTVKVVNTGTEDYDLMFGERDRHVTYPGFSMTLIRPNEYFVIDAVQAGEYTLHDHLRDKAHLRLDIR